MSHDPTPDVFGRVFVLVQHLSRRVDLALAPIGLTSRQWLLLAVLSRGFPGAAPTLSEAAALFGTSRQNVKQIAVQLVARGYLTLDVDPADARATRLRLTDRVAEFDAPDAVAGQVAVLDELFACFTPEEVAVARRPDRPVDRPPPAPPGDLMTAVPRRGRRAGDVVRALVAVVLVLHGLVHLLGVVAVGRRQIVGLGATTPAGRALWLVAALTVVAAGLGLGRGRRHWWYLGASRWWSRR